MKKLIYLLLLTLGCSCSHPTNDILTLSGLNPQNFVTKIGNRQTALFTLKNRNNMEVCVTNYGGRIVSIMVPDRNGKLQDVVLGFDSIADYIRHHNSYGATIGRFANRIAFGKLSIDGKDYQLTTGKDGHTLHGGKNGFRFQVYDAKQPSKNELLLTYLSKDGEEGFPGNLLCKVRMTVTDDNCLDIEYEAETDKPTVVNMTNHSFFNLDADPTASNADNIIQINADGFTPVNELRIPTGEIAETKNSILDFRTPRKLGEVFNSPEATAEIAQVIDLNYVLNATESIHQPCARLYSPKTGIGLQVYTNEPGLQLLASNKNKKTVKGKKGIVYKHNCSVCLETQKFPDAPNHPSWPSSILRPGEKYNSRCVYKFTVE